MVNRRDAAERHDGQRSWQRLTERLRLEPVRLRIAADLWRVHQDPTIARWYAGTWTTARAQQQAALMEEAWRRSGAGKWLAYLRQGGELIGRGGLSHVTLDGRECLELGWALLDEYQGHGYASEIGNAGLGFAFEVLGAAKVVSFTEVHNRRSRAVMERLGMHYVRRLSRPGLVEGLEGVHESAPFALYEISAAARP